MSDGVKKINEWIMKEGRVIGITKDISAAKFEGGTFFVHPNEGMLKYNNVDNTATKAWKKFVPSVIFDEKTIVRSLLADAVINEVKLEDYCVANKKYKDNSISDTKLQKDSVTTPKIKDLNVTTEKYANYSVNEHKLKDDSVTTPKLRNLCITSDKYALLSITNNHVANGSLKNEKLFNKTITHEKIADLTVLEKLIANNAVTEFKIKESAIKSKHIAINEVKTQHVLDRNILGIKIAKNCLSDEHIVLNSVNGNKLIDGSLKTINYSDLSITNNKIANQAIDMDKLDKSVQSLIKDSIRVEGANSTATVKGHLKVNGNIDATGSISGIRTYNPVFADVAEAYMPKEKLEPGDAVCLSLEGGLKVEKLTIHNGDRFLGFVSDQYATVFGATPDELRFGKKVAITLIGRIKIKSKETSANIGDFVYIVNGQVKFYSGRCASAVGRVLENKAETDQYVLCQLWP